MSVLDLLCHKTTSGWNSWYYNCSDWLPTWSWKALVKFLLEFFKIQTTFSAFSKYISPYDWPLQWKSMEWQLNYKLVIPFPGFILCGRWSFPSGVSKLLLKFEGSEKRLFLKLFLMLFGRFSNCYTPLTWNYWKILMKKGENEWEETGFDMYKLKQSLFLK